MVKQHRASGIPSYDAWCRNLNTVILFYQCLELTEGLPHVKLGCLHRSSDNGVASIASYCATREPFTRWVDLLPDAGTASVLLRRRQTQLHCLYLCCRRNLFASRLWALSGIASNLAVQHCRNAWKIELCRVACLVYRAFQPSVLSHLGAQEVLNNAVNLSLWKLC
jgi:hypothetical protein